MNGECERCKGDFSRGGNCEYASHMRFKKNAAPCLNFEEDERGKIGFEWDSKLFIPIGSKLPVIGEWSSDYCIKENDHPLKFTKVIPVEWITNRKVGIKCMVDFYYFYDSDKKSKQHSLRLVKGGGNNGQGD